jgi:hypothetical protein
MQEDREIIEYRDPKSSHYYLHIKVLTSYNPIGIINAVAKNFPQMITHAPIEKIAEEYINSQFKHLEIELIIKYIKACTLQDF